MTRQVHPELEPFLAAAPVLEFTPEALAVMRTTPLGAPPQLSDAVERTDHEVPDSGGVVVRVHRPVGVEGPLPCVYSIHGGGYVIGSRDMDDAKFDAWCPRVGCVGVSVEYRLSPETAFPGPLDDCYAGLQWVHANAAQLGIDPARIGVTGVSAGGGLAAALVLLARDRGEIPLVFQLLDCPMIDDRQVTHSSQADGLHIWSREANTFGWKAYLGELYGTDDVPYLAAPARCDDLSGLPPTYLCVGTADGFCDEDITYAQRLMQAGVPTDLHVHAGAPHGVALFQGTAIAERYSRGPIDWLTRHLAAT